MEGCRASLILARPAVGGRAILSGRPSPLAASVMEFALILLRLQQSAAEAVGAGITATALHSQYYNVPHSIASLAADLGDAEQFAAAGRHTVGRAA